MTPGQRLDALARQGEWNPYHLAYGIATGATDPGEASAHDGNNLGFMEWDSARWRETWSAKG